MDTESMKLDSWKEQVILFQIKKKTGLKCIFPWHWSGARHLLYLYVSITLNHG